MNRKYKLKSSKEISLLFKEGKFLFTGNLKLVYKLVPEIEQNICQIAISVPKRNFKKAVDRNKIKRQIRSVFSNRISDFLQKLNYFNLKFIIIYNSKENLSFSEIEFQIIKILNILEKEITKAFEFKKTENILQA